MAQLVVARLLLLVLLVEAVARWSGTLGLKPPASGNLQLTTTPNLSGDALRALLRGSGTGGANCSVVLLADDTLTAQELIKDLPVGFAEGGTTLLRLPAPHDPTKHSSNVTSEFDLHLQQLYKIGRKVRFATGCLTVVFASDSPVMLEAMLEHSTADRLLMWRTFAVVVTALPKKVALAVAESKWTFTMMNSVLLLLRRSASQESAVVLRHEPYSPVGARIRVLAYYTLQRGLSVVAPLHFEKFDYYFGGGMKYSTLPFHPYWDEKVVIEPDGSKTTVAWGSEYELFMCMSKALNFTLVTTNPTTWTEVVEQVNNRTAHIIPMLYFVMVDRLEMFDYLAPYLYTDIAYAWRDPGMGSGWDNFMLPFHPELWLFILITLLIVCVSIVVVLKYSTSSEAIYCKLRGGVQVSGSNTKTESWSRASFEVFGAVLGQDFTFKMPNTNSFRILITAWFVFIIVLSTGYKSNLISFMTLPKIPFRPETLSELVDANIKITVPYSYGKDHQTSLRKSSNPDHQTMATRYVFVSNPKEGIDMILAQGTAYTDMRDYLEYEVNLRYLQPDGSSEVYVAKEAIIKYLSSWLIPHDAPYKAQLDNIKMHVIETGIYRKWVIQELENLRIKKAEEAKNNPELVETSSQKSRVKPLQLEQLQGPFWILMIGEALAMLCFLFEVSLIAFKNKHKRQDGSAEQ